MSSSTQVLAPLWETSPNQAEWEILVGKMNKTFEVFEKHINNCDNGYQEGDDRLAVAGPLTGGQEPLDLYVLATEHAPEGNIIEIGSWLGLSTITLALALKERYKEPIYKLYAIDPHDKDHSIVSEGIGTVDLWFDAAPKYFDWHQLFLDNIKKWDVEDYIEVRREFSHDSDISSIDNVSMVWIDGDHREEPFYGDLNKFVEKADADAVIAMHDQHEHAVIRALKRYKDENPNVLEPIGTYNDDGILIEVEWNSDPSFMMGFYRKKQHGRRFIT